MASKSGNQYIRTSRELSQTPRWLTIQTITLRTAKNELQFFSRSTESLGAVAIGIDQFVAELKHKDSSPESMGGGYPETTAEPIPTMSPPATATSLPTGSRTERRAQNAVISIRAE